jgi:tryptophan-rich sensory protein
MMAISAWLVWRKGGWPAARTPLAWFGVQLALNVGWSIAFFGLQVPGIAFVEIVLLWLSIMVTTFAFGCRSALAAWLLVPYLAWTTFAAVLNAAIWRLNS